MFKNYFKIAFRNALRNKRYAILNIAGLAIGMACSLLIVLYVKHELSFDKFHKNANRIYRMVEEYRNGDNISQRAMTQEILAPALEEFFPEFSQIVRVDVDTREKLLAYEENQFYEKGFISAEPNFFDIFSFDLIQGNPKTAIAEFNSVVITESIAKKYFGDEEALGKILLYENNQPWQITGIIRDVPENSHFKFNFLTRRHSRNENRRFCYTSYTYTLLTPDVSPESIENRIPGFVQTYVTDNQANRMFRLQPLTDIHLHSHTDSEIEANSDVLYIRIFAAIAGLILLIACINYMNLALAQTAQRNREVGMRKVLGARRSQLIRQFVSESILFTLIALLFAVLLVELLTPYFEQLFEINFAADSLTSLPFLFSLIGITLIVGIFSGSYPAFYLSAHRPVNVLKGISSSGNLITRVRKTLLVAQFVISIVLILCALVMTRQLHFIQNKKLGFDKEQVVALTHFPNSLQQQYKAFKQALLQNPHIVAVSSGGYPGESGGAHGSLKVIGSEVECRTEIMFVDFDYIKTMGITLQSGRDFSREFASDVENAFIINEAAEKAIGLEDAIGQKLQYWHTEGTVIGVVKDFHKRSLYESIIPMVLNLEPEQIYNCLVKISPGNMTEALAHLKKTWKTFAPDWPVQITYLDQHLAQQYQFEQKLARIFNVATFLAIFVSCLGLFGLASISTEQRTKEIGIRKVLGASVVSIVSLFSNEYCKWIILANLLAWPIAWYTMNRWLQNFAYRIEISWWMFALAGGLALGVALLTVSWQAVRVATANPVEALRYE